MKLTITSLTLTLTSLLTLSSAIFAPSTHLLVARKVQKYKPAWSVVGKCNAHGSCDFGGDGHLPARCKLSTCDTPGSKCTVAYSDTAPTVNSGTFATFKEAKCPVNNAGYEWEWPWVDQAWKDASEAYERCKTDTVALRGGEVRKEDKKTFSRCEMIEGGPA